MIENLTIENYRCFNKLELKDLKQINLIIGGNMSGKSSILDYIKETQKCISTNNYDLSTLKNYVYDLDDYIYNSIKNKDFYTLSDGIQKMIKILYMIQDNKNTIILLDDLDLHIHCTYMYLFLIHILTIANNNQLFITTHSYDLLKGLYDIKKLNNDNFKCYIIENKNIRTLGYDVFDNYIGSGINIRKWIS